MVPIDTAIGFVASLPEVTAGAHYGNRTWFVGKQAIVWLRPFSKADRRRFGDAPVPTGPIFAVRTADLRHNDEVLALGLRGVFTIPHFDGHPAVLLQLDRMLLRDVEHLVTDAWLAASRPAVAVRPRRRGGAQPQRATPPTTTAGRSGARK